MLRHCFIVAMLVAASWSLTASGAEYEEAYRVGAAMRTFRPDAPREWRGAQTQALVTRIWYPVDLTIPVEPHDIGPLDHPLFRGHALANNAPLSSAHTNYPLLLVSHGTAGSAEDLDWLASALAAHGYIVAGVNHPGNSLPGPLTREGFTLWWERATDLSNVLDGMLADPTFASHIDRDKIGGVGYSLGGYTVLELVGAHTDLPAFEAFCHSPAADSNCHPPTNKSNATAATPLPPEALASLKRAGASYRDPRVRAAFVIAPAIGRALSAQSLTRVEVPVRLIAGTADTTAPPPSNILRIAPFLPHAQIDMIEGATHSTFLGTCLPAALSTLTNICTEAPGVDRDAIHQLAIEQALSFFGASLGGNASAIPPQAGASQPH